MIEADRSRPIPSCPEEDKVLSTWISRVAFALRQYLKLCLLIGSLENYCRSENPELEIMSTPHISGIYVTNDLHVFTIGQMCIQVTLSRPPRISGITTLRGKPTARISNTAQVLPSTYQPSHVAEIDT